MWMINHILSHSWQLLTNHDRQKVTSDSRCTFLKCFRNMFKSINGGFEEINQSSWLISAKLSQLNFLSETGADSVRGTANSFFLGEGNDMKAKKKSWEKWKWNNYPILSQIASRQCTGAKPSRRNISNPSWGLGKIWKWHWHLNPKKMTNQSARKLRSDY